jgi:outer membrane protein insertion porin family
MLKYTNVIFVIFLFLPFKLFSSSLIFQNLNKLSLDDIQALTSIDINKDHFNDDEINTIIKELYSSDLIFNLTYSKQNANTIVSVDESKLINSILINGNLFIKDEEIETFLISSENDLLNKNTIKKDIVSLKNIYYSEGFDHFTVSVLTEEYSQNKVNLIFEINEGKQSKINNILFYGNNFFSDRFLKNLIKSEELGFFSFFKSGSNLNNNLFNFDKSLIIDSYQDFGFFDIDVSYQLEKNMLNNYDLVFYIDENERKKIEKISYNILTDDIELSSIKEISQLNDQLKNNSLFYDSASFDDLINSLNKSLFQLNENNFFSHSLKKINQKYEVEIQEFSPPKNTINKIEIIGNAITKDKTLRSKLNIEPGDNYSKEKIDKLTKDLKSLKFVNNVTISKSSDSNNTDLTINIDENKKTGSFLLGGSFSGDTGLGAAFSIKDSNILGTGNEVDTSINFNSERTLFKISYTQYPYLIKNIRNIYTIFNQENDLSDSFGYENKTRGIGYSISFDYSQNTRLSSGINYSQEKGHSGINNNTFIQDNIGSFDNISFNFNILNDTTNDFLYPTNGFKNSFQIILSPENLSDDNYYKITNYNDIYINFKKSSNFIFFSNNIGLAESLSGNLKTKNTFSLGGLNFKGFDYRGIGPFNGNAYLGGNKYFTSTIGYGSSFLFDQKDNINMKFFATTGSIWDSDYSENNQFELRSSMGLTLDLLADVFPISFSYAIPIEKNKSDKIRRFNFSIGTSF